MTYSYDGVGNRLTESQSGVTETHTYSTTNNRLTHQSGLLINYDAAGNPLNNHLGTHTYTYDAANRQATVTENSQLIATYTYNALGQRVSKQTAIEYIDFVYDLSGRLLGEYANGSVVREYIFADGVLVAQVDATTVTYLHVDQLSTPRMATDAAGTIIWRWDSDPFGEAVPNEDPDGDLNDVTVPLRFPGQYADMETGHYYNYFRNYDPSVGRYTQSDPIGLNGGVNRYAYANTNPLTYSDPLGLHAVVVPRPIVGPIARPGSGIDPFIAPIPNQIREGELTEPRIEPQVTPSDRPWREKRGRWKVYTRCNVEEFTTGAELASCPTPSCPSTIGGWGFGSSFPQAFSNAQHDANENLSSLSVRGCYKRHCQPIACFESGRRVACPKSGR